ncbi:hypothetical protein BDQ17DRAFT_1545363 [Cyathus striatus]|nr:hypothetical protein BDQ17DRAFT_1545363 [Cyathus striatus]
MDIISPLRAIESAPNLEFLSFILVGGEAISLTSKAVDGNIYILGAAPRLSKVILVGVPEPPLILTRLSYVDLHSLQTNFDEIKSFFAASPGLKTLVLHHLLPSPEPMSHQSHTVVVPSLRELGVSFAKSTTGTPSYFFEYCKFTKLEYLELDGECDFASSALAGSVAISEICTVKISNMTFHPLAATPIYQLLHSMSNLRHIQLFNVPVSTLFMNRAAKPLGRKRSLELQPVPKLMEIRRAELFQRVEETPAVPHTFWPKLHTITVDSLVGGDLASVCNFVNAHQNIRKVQLSASSKRHILHSVRRMADDRFEVPGIRSRNWGHNEGVLDAFQWLKSRVVIEDIVGTEGLL